MNYSLCLTTVRKGRYAPEGFNSDDSYRFYYISTVPLTRQFQAFSEPINFLAESSRVQYVGPARVLHCGTKTVLDRVVPGMLSVCKHSRVTPGQCKAMHDAQGVDM